MILKRLALDLNQKGMIFIKRKGISKIGRALEIPEEVISDTPKITCLGFEKISIENYKNILEYQDVIIRINTSMGIININGFDLKMEEMTTDDIVVEGKIDSIDFEELEE